MKHFTSMLARPERAASGLLAVLLAAAVVLRLGFLMHEDVWYDEAWSIHFCGESWREMARGVRADLHPLLYYCSAKVFSIPFGGASRVSMRLFSALWGLCAILTCGLVGRRMFGRWTVGLVSAVVLAWLPMHLSYSAECRMYTMGGSLVLLGGWGWLEIERSWRSEAPRRRMRWALLLGPLCCAAAISTHFVTGIQLAVIALVFAPWTNRRRWADWLCYWMLAAALTIPEALSLLFRGRLLWEGAPWLPRPGAIDALRGLGRGILVPVDYWTRWSNTVEERWWGWLLVDFLPILVMAWFASGVRSLPRGERRVPGLLLAGFVIASMVQWFLTRLGLGCFFWLRYGVLLLPLAAVSSGPILLQLWERSRTDRAILIVLAALIAGVGTHASVTRAHRWYGPVREFLEERPKIEPLYVFGTDFWPEYEINLGKGRIKPGHTLPLSGNDSKRPHYALVIDVPEQQRPEGEALLIKNWLPVHQRERVLESDAWILWRVD